MVSAAGRRASPCRKERHFPVLGSTPRWWRPRRMRGAVLAGDSGRCRRNQRWNEALSGPTHASRVGRPGPELAGRRPAARRQAAADGTGGKRARRAGPGPGYPHPVFQQPERQLGLGGQHRGLQRQDTTGCDQRVESVRPAPARRGSRSTRPPAPSTWPTLATTRSR